jgi:putative ABC transport system permease protein
VSRENVEAARSVTKLKIRLAGIEPSYWKTIMALCQEGRLINNADVEHRRQVCVLGEEAALGLFGDVSPVGETVSVDNLMLLVVGVLGGIQGPDTRRSIFIPLSLARSRFADMYSIKELRIRVDHWDAVESSTREISEALGAAHPGYRSGIRVRSFPERVKRVRHSVQMVKSLSVLACSVAIVLGCIGAAYLMKSVVQERTREIGLKKAVGWTDSMVLLQFLLESLSVFVLGGGVGVVAAVISCLTLEYAAGFTIDSFLLLTSAVAALGALGVCGLVAGFYPAVRAGKMDPIEAMRFE